MATSEASMGRGGRGPGFRRVSGGEGGEEEEDLGTVPEDEEVLIAPRRSPLREGRSNVAQGGGVLSALLEHRCFLYTYSTLLLVFSLAALILTIRHGGPPFVPDDDQGPGSSKEPAAPTLRLEGYDFIVVGAGPAGSVIARQLSEDPNRTVLLIETGGPTQGSLGGRNYIVPNMTLFDLPLGWSTVAHNPLYAWDVKDAMIAKGLGGCGIHNAMLSVRAVPKDLEAWGMEDAGWTWDEALSIYKRLEDFDGPTSPYHGRGGPLRTSPPLYIDPVAPYFLEASRVVGIPISDDFNAPGGRMGASYYNFNIRNGIRQSAAAAFLGPVMNTRDNLDVYPFATVQRVVFETNKSGSYTAKGVMLRTDKGEVLEARLKDPGKGSVVLTAGALGSPKILMNSGVGDAAKLKKAGIPVLNELKGVGANLQDHPVIPVTFRLVPELAARVSAAFGGGFEELNNYAEWVRSGAGPLNRAGGNGGGVGAASGAGLPSSFKQSQAPYLFYGSTGFTAGAFLRSDKGSKNPKLQVDYPDLQLTVFPRVTEPHLLAKKKENASAAADAESKDGESMLITIALLDPEARYTVELNKQDPLGPVRLNEIHFPQVEGGGLLSALDAAKLTYGVRMVRVIAQTYPMNQAAQEEVAPGSGVVSEAELVEWVRKSRYINSHWCGSAKMGHADDPMAVVDGRLRVFNMEGLRVADASVFPTIPSGNTHSTVLMVAMRAAELILEDYHKGGGDEEE